MAKAVFDIETTELEPWSGEIICIGIKDVETDKTHVFRGQKEEETVRSFAKYGHRRDFDEIIGYNVIFDIRYVFAKCMKYGITAGNLFNSHYKDLMSTMKSVKPVYNHNKPGKLNQWLVHIFEEAKMLDNEDIPELYEDGEVDKIIEYCRKDVELTYKLWERSQLVLKQNEC